MHSLVGLRISRLFKNSGVTSFVCLDVTFVSQMEAYDYAMETTGSDGMN